MNRELVCVGLRQVRVGVSHLGYFLPGLGQLLVGLGLVWFKLSVF